MSKKTSKGSPPKNVTPKIQIEQSSMIERLPWLEYILVGLIIIVLFFLRKNFVGIAFERDEGDYAMFGKWLLSGAKPYVDFYEMKPPGIFISYAWMVKIFGYEYTGLQTGFCFVYALILLFSYLFFKKFIGRNIALFLLPVYGFLLLNSGVSGFTIQAEFLVLLFVVAGLFTLMIGKERENLLLLMLSGILLGYAVLIKQAGVFYCLFGALILIAEWWRNRKMRKLVLELSALIIGGIIPVALVILWLQMQGVTHEAFFWMVEFPGKYYLSDQSFSAGMHLLGVFSSNIMNEQPFFWGLAFAGLFSGLFLKIPIEKKILIYLFVTLSGATIVPGLRFMSHYWILFMPGIAVLIALTYKLILQLIGTSKFLRTAAAVFFIAVPAIHFVNSVSYYLYPDFIQILHNVYGSNPFPETKEIGDYLKKNMKEGDQIFVAGSEPQIYLYTNTLGISRHNFINFINAKTPFAKQWQLEAIHDVETKKPRYIVLVVHPFSWMLDKESDMTFFHWTQQYFDQNYNQVLLADQIDTRGDCKYVLGKDILTYQRVGKQFVLVYERK